MWKQSKSETFHCISRTSHVCVCVCVDGVCDAKIKLSHYEIGDGVYGIPVFRLKCQTMRIFEKKKSLLYLVEMHEQSLHNEGEQKTA